MSWIGLRDRDTALWQPRGLSRPARGSAEPARGPDRAGRDEVMPRGALVLEFAVEAGSGRRNVLRHSTRDPWESMLSVTVEADGAIAVLQGWRGESRGWRLAVPGLSEGETLVLTLQWDGPARAGLVSAWLPDRPALFLVPAAPPLPLHRADAARMMTDARACMAAPGVAYLALSDQPVPLGPVGGVHLSAPVEVPGGALPAMDLRAGDAVQLAEGGLARIVWAGTARVPARGRCRPYLLRAPYNGLRADIMASGDLRLRLRGSDIDYVFGTEVVAATVRQLADQRSVVPLLPPPVARYRQFLLDRPGALVVGGAVVEPYDLAALGGDRRLISVSAPGRAALALGRMPQDGVRPLKDYEALSLRRMRAA